MTQVRLVARLVAAIPPAALVLSFELLMRQLRAALRPGTEPDPAVEPRFVVTPTPAAAEPRHDLAPSTSGSLLLERARDIYAAHRQANKRVTGTILARELGISEGYGRRLLRQLVPNDSGTA